MKELCIPIPNLEVNQVAELTVSIADTDITYLFRIESFPWISDMGSLPQDSEKSESFARIFQLKKAIAEYDTNWELIQIFTPPQNATHIQVLYRKRT